MQCIELLVVGHDQVRITGDLEVGSVHSPALEHFHLGEKDKWINHDTVSNYGNDVGVQHT